MRKRFKYYFILIFLVYCSNICYGQDDIYRYVMLDEIEQDCKIKKYTLNTKEHYGIDETIEMYNFMIMDDYTILISVLPDLYSESNWTEIDVNAIKNKITSKDNSWNRLCNHYLKSEDPNDKKDWKFKLVKKYEDKWYASNQTLFEFFIAKNFPQYFSLPFWYLNIGQEPISMRTMKDSIYPNLPLSKVVAFPLYGIPGYNTGFPSELKKHFLSSKIENGNVTFYRFWSLNHWNTTSPALHRGIDRLVYSTEHGVVAGSYDYYFADYSVSFERRVRRNATTKTLQELMELALDEKVMWAEELKHLKLSDKN